MMDRRTFIQTTGGATLLAASGGLVSWVMQSPPADRLSRPFYKASTFAAQMKSFSDNPPTECVENAIRQ
jgi:hypothetical protein